MNVPELPQKKGLIFFCRNEQIRGSVENETKYFNEEWQFTLLYICFILIAESRLPPLQAASVQVE